MPVAVYTGAQSSIGNAITTVFAYGWKILDQAHIEVKVDGVVKALGGDYTVQGVGNSNGGSVTFLVAPAVGAVVQRARKVPYQRDEDYQANGDFKEETVDKDFDLREMQIQQIAADIARAFKAPLSVIADQVLTDAMWAARAGLMLGFDGAGNLGVFAALNPANPASAFVLTLLDDPDANTFVQTLVASLVAEAAPAVDDVAVIGDTSEGKGNKMRLDDLLKVINVLPQDKQPARTADFLTSYDTSAAAAKKVLLDDLPLPRSYLAGYGLANNALDLVNDIDFAVGACRSTADTDNILLAAALTKQLDVAWAVGTNQGMRASGAAIADTTYHLFAIKRPDTGVVDVAADTSITGANIAANTNAAYTEKRRIGSIVRSAGSIIAFVQTGDEVIWTTMKGDVSTNQSTVAASYTLTVPTGLKVLALLEVHHASSTTGDDIWVSSLDQTSTAISAATNFNAGGVVSGAPLVHMQSSLQIRTNASGQVRAIAGSASVNLTIATRGYVDRRGRDD